jgi:hypothetical protein
MQMSHQIDQFNAASPFRANATLTEVGVRACERATWSDCNGLVLGDSPRAAVPCQVFAFGDSEGGSYFSAAATTLRSVFLSRVEAGECGRNGRRLLLSERVRARAGPAKSLGGLACADDFAYGVAGGALFLLKTGERAHTRTGGWWPLTGSGRAGRRSTTER